MGTRFYTVAEVAALLRVRVTTVQGWLRDGKLTGVAVSRKSGYRIAEADLEAFIAERTGRTMLETEAATAAA